MSLFCHRNNHTVQFVARCGICRHRRRCDAYQRHLQPELPLTFGVAERRETILQTQDHVKRTLDALPEEEYERLFRKALSLLPPNAAEKRILVRIKIYELLLAAAAEPF